MGRKFWKITKLLHNFPCSDATDGKKTLENEGQTGILSEYFGVGAEMRNEYALFPWS
jgi:hypothetical protein